MKETVEYILHDDNTIYRHFSTVEDDGTVIASGYVGIEDKELLALYETNPELAMQDSRMESLLNPPEPVEPEPTEEELIQAEILLNQAEILAKQNEQDEVLAEILLNQMGV